MTAPASGPRRVLLQLALVALASAAVVAWVQSSSGGLYGYDGHFHIRFSEWLRHNGITHTFPWWQETFLAERYADKDFLFHVLLMPFTFGDLEAGGKAASIVFAVGLYLAILLSLAALRVRMPAAWAITALLTSTTLLYRAGLMRSVVLAIAIAVLGTAAIVRGSRAGTAIAAAAYASSHITWQVLPGIALIHDLARSMTERRVRWSGTAFAIAGTAAAVVLSPFFPENLRFWYVNNIGVLSMSWSAGAPDLGLGIEILPGRPADLLAYNIGPATLTLAGIAVLGAALRRRGARAALAGTITLGVVTTGFLAASLLSRRFVEFWAPMSVLFAAQACTHAPAWEARPNRRRLIVAAAAAVAALGAWNVTQARRVIGDNPGRVYDGCASWIRDHVPPGETVFTTDWDEFPELFFVAPRQHYLVGFDPTFMHATDPGRWRLWRDIAEGRSASLAGPIAEVFGCRAVFAGIGYDRFVERADQDPWLRPGHADGACSVYGLRDDVPPSSAPSPVATWRLDPDNGERLAAGPSDFIDVTRLAGAGGNEGDCVRLVGVLRAPQGGALRLAISSDDTIAVTVGGLAALDTATAPPPTLDEAIARQRAGDRRRFEHAFEAAVREGDNEIVVSVCRKGTAWGFHLMTPVGP